MIRLRCTPPEAPSKSRFKELLRRFPQHRKRALGFPFAQLPWADPSTFAALRLGKKFSRLAVAGMGGASLGAKALLRGLGKNAVFLDNADPDFIHAVLKNLNLKKTLFLLISKSGETIEINSLGRLLFKKLPSPGNFLAITDLPDCELGTFAAAHRIPVLRSPANIPGRFSVLSLVGLLPAALGGVHVRNLLSGAQKTHWKSAYELAAMQYLHARRGRNITVFFPYGEAFSALADWYIQLLAESIGKSPNAGLTPVKAMGVKDQHSQLQLFLDGPDDKFTIFLKTDASLHDEKIPGRKFSLKQLFDAQYEGVQRAFARRKKPFAQLTIPALDEAHLGELFFFLELEVAFLGSLMGVNIENQPAVELSKKITKSLLKLH